MFFYVGKVFCLRGGQEQRDLKLSQVVRSSNPDCYTYVENGLFMRAQILVQDVWFFSLIYTFPSFQIMQRIWIVFTCVPERNLRVIHHGMTVLQLGREL